MDENQLQEPIYEQLSEIAKTYSDRISSKVPGVTIYTHVLNACQRTAMLAERAMIDRFVVLLRQIEQEVTDGLITGDELHRLTSRIESLNRQRANEEPPTNMELLIGRQVEGDPPAPPEAGEV